MQRFFIQFVTNHRSLSFVEDAFLENSISVSLDIKSSSLDMHCCKEASVNGEESSELFLFSMSSMADSTIGTNFSPI